MSALERLGVLACLAAGIAVTGCQSSDSKAAEDRSSAQKTAVTADYLHRTLSFIDFDTVVSQPDAGTSARLGELDLSQYEQAPYGVKLTPDGRTAIVTLSPGFFIVPGAAALLLGDPTMPTGPSKVLLIDVASKSVKSEIETGDGAAGITTSPDGRLAFVTHTATRDLSVIDLQAGTLLQQIDTGGTFAEDVQLDDTGTVGIVTCLDSDTGKSARTFAVADVPITLSAPIPLENDAAGVPFFPGTKMAFVVLAYNPINSPTAGYALIDASDPHAPVKLIETKWTDAIYVTFAALAAPTRGTVLMPVASEGNLEMREYALGAGDVTLENSWPVTPLTGFGPFGVVLDRQGRMLMTLPGNRALGVLDLRDGRASTVPWFPEPGPIGIDLY